jgi:hypothetical protein
MTACTYCENPAHISYTFRHTPVLVCWSCLGQIMGNGRILPRRLETKGEQVDSFWYIASNCGYYSVYHLAVAEVGKQGVYEYLCRRNVGSTAVGYGTVPEGKRPCRSCELQLELGR